MYCFHNNVISLFVGNIFKTGKALAFHFRHNFVAKSFEEFRVSELEVVVHLLPRWSVIGFSCRSFLERNMQDSFYLINSSRLALEEYLRCGVGPSFFNC